MINKDFVRFGGGGETLLSPLGLGVLLLAAILIFSLRRKYIVVPLLVAAILIPLSQQIVIVGLHFTSLRLLIACGWLRILTGGFRMKLRTTKIDVTLVAWVLSAALAFTLLWASMDAIVNRMGMLYDSLGMYFLLRVLLRDEEDLWRTAKVMSLIALFLGACMLSEHFSGLNVFYVFGVDKLSAIRDGHIRAQGPFLHAILAGCFGGTLMALFAGMWWQARSRLTSFLGMLGATAMTLSSFSSTAMLAWGAGLAALFLWPLRKYMKVLRWAVVVVLIGLHLAMKAPVWALIARIDLAGGSSGYHRFELINQAILHFNEWWLIGEKTTYQWGYNLWDTANTYVETAVTGGIFTLLLLIATVSICFQALGKTRKTTTDRGRARLTWILGSVLFAHLVAFIGITYYDQTIVSWYLLLAMVSAATIPSVKSAKESEKLRNVGAPVPCAILQER